MNRPEEPIPVGAAPAGCAGLLFLVASAAIFAGAYAALSAVFGS